MYLTGIVRLVIMQSIMLAFERRRRIAESIRSRGSLSVSEMAEAFGTSEITLRRDLRVLADEGLLVRTHGGAVLPEGLVREPTYSEKASQAAAEKSAIASAAARMVRSGESIVLGPGTTTLALARLLVDFDELTVATNSLLVAEALTGTRVEVIMTGGALRHGIHALVGPAAEESLRTLRASQVFLSGNGLTAERGLSTPSPLVAAADRALAAAAQRLVVLADHTKIGRESMYQTVPPEGISMVITDCGVDPGQLAAIRAAGVSVVVAEIDDQPSGPEARRLSPTATVE
jgi:DeoR/GlpR family transcriptional regulator of sugar metabolism